MSVALVIVAVILALYAVIALWALDEARLSVTRWVRRRRR